MELYYVIMVTDRAKAEDAHAVLHQLKLPLILTNLGYGTATSEHLSLYNLEASQKALMSTVADRETLDKIIHLAKKEMYIDIPGNGILMAIPMKSIGGGKLLSLVTDGKNMTGGKPKMEFQHELIIVVLNEGYSDNVMDAARKAGAAGGTVLHAKGTGKGRAEKFLGVSLADEKDVIYIVSSSNKKSDIMKAITNECGTGTKIGAICFSLPISEVAGLRQFED